MVIWGWDATFSHFFLVSFMFDMDEVETEDEGEGAYVTRDDAFGMFIFS